MVEQAGGDVDELATQLECMIDMELKKPNASSPRQCIFRVPDELRRKNPEVYTPNGFSIGPIHYNKPHLRATQGIKLKYLHRLISRFPNTTKLRDLTKAISEIQEEAWECYEGPIVMSRGEFVKVLVLDGCFLIELFRKRVYRKLREEDNAINVGSISQSLYHDLILLENQIPWLVLAHLFDMTRTQNDHFELHKLVLDSVCSMSTNLDILGEEVVQGKLLTENFHHLLGLIRWTMVLLSSREVLDDSLHYWRDWKRMPSATILHEAGIKFKKARNSTASILDIKFKKGVLEIPQLVVHETTESLLCNLICFEHCLPRSDGPPHCYGIITSYAKLMDNLIHTAQDMEILCKRGIIESWLRIEESVPIFNQLCSNDTIINDFFYVKLTDDVQKHCQRRFARYRTGPLREYLNYFKHPWAYLSAIVATVILILTFLQTLYTMKG